MHDGFNFKQRDGQKIGDPERNRTSNWGLGIPRYIRLTTGPAGGEYSVIMTKYKKGALVDETKTPFFVDNQLTLGFHRLMSRVIKRFDAGCDLCHFAIHQHFKF